MIPKPICCLHVYFGSTFETSRSWQVVWKEPVKLKQVVFLLFSPSAKTIFSFISSCANIRSQRRDAAGVEAAWKHDPVGSSVCSVIKKSCDGNKRVGLQLRMVWKSCRTCELEQKVRTGAAVDSCAGTDLTSLLGFTTTTES